MFKKISKTIIGAMFILSSGIILGSGTAEQMQVNGQFFDIKKGLEELHKIAKSKKKQKIAAEIEQLMVKEAGCQAGDTYIFFQETEKENFAESGRLYE